jgi:hypothetical protein
MNSQRNNVYLFANTVRHAPIIRQSEDLILLRDTTLSRHLSPLFLSKPARRVYTIKIICYLRRHTICALDCANQ